MSQLENFGKLRERFSAGVDFVTIYISEAHPSEQVIFYTGFLIFNNLLNQTNLLFQEYNNSIPVIF